jgi:ATP-binding cassette, subfamily B, bacterial
MKALSAKLQHGLRQIPYLPRAFALIRSAAGGLLVLWLVLLLAQGLLPAAVVYVSRAVVDGLAAVLGTNQAAADIQPLLLLIGALALVLLLGEVLRIVSGLVRALQSERVQDHIYNLIHDKALSLDLAFYDSPDYYDRLHRARVDALNRPTALLENFGAFLQNGITLAAMCVVLLRFGAWLPLILVVSTLPALWVVLYNTLRFHDWRIRNTAAERRSRYYDWLITDRPAAAELRIFALGDRFRRTFQHIRKRLRSERFSLLKAEAWGQLAAGAFGLASLGGVLVWMAGRASHGLMTLGDLTLFFLSFTQGQRMMRDLLSQAGEIYRNMMFLENLFEYLNATPRIADPPQPLDLSASGGAVEIRGLAFSYTQSLHPILQDFNLTIPQGQIVAIVGENGAGKSTLIKLLCRFYDPDDGRILLDGKDLRDVSLSELRRRITVLFQEPVRYHETVFDNIAFSNLDAAPDPGAVQNAARSAGAHAIIGRLENGYETVLGKWFGGAELSVGEWQRLALARAFLRQASLVILDEPTSAMDSWTEADWMARFRSLVAGRTALIITHRFTTALQADIIHVVDKGRIIESGSHAQLLARQGRYAASWQRQMGS